MFTIKWVVRYHEHKPVEVEESALTDLGRIVGRCKEELYAKRLRNILKPPDGFIVCDEDGNELRRWMTSPIEAPNAIAPSRATSHLPSRRSAFRNVPMAEEQDASEGSRPL
jgi:hypothetical protein